MSTIFSNIAITYNIIKGVIMVFFFNPNITNNKGLDNIHGSKCFKTTRKNFTRKQTENLDKTNMDITEKKLSVKNTTKH